MNPQQVYQKVNESIYVVHAKKSKKDGKVSRTLASAVAVSEKLLATNCHAVDEDVLSFSVEIDGENIPGRVVKSYKTKDLCIVEVPGTTFKPVKIRATGDVKVGEDV